jgi:hypothetical protein
LILVVLIVFSLLRFALEPDDSDAVS